MALGSQTLNRPWRNDEGALLARMDRTYGLMDRKLYGPCAMLRAEDVDLGHAEILIRNGKGVKDR